MDSASGQARPTLNVTVAGGGPVGLMFALGIKDLMPEEVVVDIFDGRWTRSNSGVVWRGRDEGNARREQVVTIQSRQYSRFPKRVQEALFSDKSNYSEMWPVGPDLPHDLGPPRNFRIAYIEDRLLELAAREPHINLRAEDFDPKLANLGGGRVLVISDGGGSNTRGHYARQFGREDTAIYSLDGINPLQDTVLGLRVKSNLPDATAVVVTIAQNRYLLNSLRGDGFLNMRLAPEEVREVIGYNVSKSEIRECIPCLMVRRSSNDFVCAHHEMHFKPALDAKVNASALWPRVLEGLRLFDIPEKQLTAITAFRLQMVQRPRFTAELMPPTRTSGGTYGALLGDAANAIHFWPGRGLNSGFAAAQSLARTLAQRWTMKGVLRDSDFMRHEAAMGMLQYRHKTRAWRAMVATDADGQTTAIQQVIGNAYRTPATQPYDKIFLDRLGTTRDRLQGRLNDLPNDRELERIVSRTSDQTLKVLVESGPWDTSTMGGEEADIDLLWPGSSPLTAPRMPPKH